MQPESRRKRFQQIGVSGLGLGVPLLAAIVAFPLLLRNLGLEQFGLFGILWTLIGYSTLFEFGLGKGVTREVSGRADDTDHVRRIVSTSLIFAIGLSVIGIVALWFGLPLIFATILTGSADYLDDAIRAGHYLVFAFPFIVTAPIFYGLLEARQNFRLSAMFRAATGVLAFLVPAAVTMIWANVPAAIASIAIVRACSTVILGVIALRTSHARLRFDNLDMASGIGLLRYGGWVTLSTVITPMLVYADRFFLTHSHGLAATSLYLIPFELLIRFMILPSAISTVVFPRFAAGNLTRREGLKLLRESSVMVLLAFGIPAVLLITAVLLQGDLLASLIGTVEVWHLTAILTFGFIFMSLTYVPQIYVQAHGRADIMAMFNVVEMLLWLAYTPYLINHYAAQGAAVAFCIRTIFGYGGVLLLIRYMGRSQS